MLNRIKEKKCRLKTCRKIFQPATEWQKFCNPHCRYTQTNRNRAALVRRAQKIIDAQETGA